MSSHAQKNDSVTSQKNAVKIDLIPFYYDFFDYRKQIRMGIEYERKINQKYFFASELDIGLFDEYNFTKYYDFFSQNLGMFYIKQNVQIKGFHFIPSYNYCLWRSKIKVDQGLFGGGNIEYRLYHKKLDYYNSQTNESSSDAMNQTTIGAGVNLRIKYLLFKHFYCELKTAFSVAFYNHRSTNNPNFIKSLNAQWTDNKNRFWWVSNIKICYAF